MTCDLQSEVAEWHRTAFPDCQPVDIIKKLGEEVAELAMALGVSGYIDHTGSVREELADVATVILALADRCQVDLTAAIEANLADVRERYPPR